MLEFIGRAVLIGVGATALIDLWALVLKRLFGIPPANWAMIGRWFAWIPRGRLMHGNIAETEPVANELAIGWICHYAVGILFAAITLVIGGPGWGREPTLLPALFVGVVTVGCGWFIIQPGIGIGIAASKRPNANQIRLLGLVSHVIFGLGMYAVARLIA